MLSKGACSLCKSFTELIYKESHTENAVEYKLYECSICKSQFWIPFKNPGSKWYENDERYSSANSNPTLEPNWNHKKVVSFLAPFVGKVLDIGCGTGNFLSYAKKEGWDVVGIDFDRNAVNTAVNVFKLPNISVDSLESFYKKYLDSDKFSFDLVTFFDVFEHIDNHFEFLNIARNILINNGHVAMSMPYRKSFHWLQPNDFPPRHLTRWDRSSLKYFLESNGFKVVYIKRVPASFFYIVMKLRFRYGRFVSFDGVNKIKAKIKNDMIENPSVAKVLTKESTKIKVVHLLAKIKDLIIFGLPAGLIWVSLLLTNRRYNGLFAIAKKTSK